MSEQPTTEQLFTFFKEFFTKLEAIRGNTENLSDMIKNLAEMIKGSFNLSQTYIETNEKRLQELLLEQHKRQQMIQNEMIRLSIETEHRNQAKMHEIHTAHQEKIQEIHTSYQNIFMQIMGKMLDLALAYIQLRGKKDGSSVPEGMEAYIPFLKDLLSNMFAGSHSDHIRPPHTHPPGVATNEYCPACNQKEGESEDSEDSEDSEEDDEVAITEDEFKTIFDLLQTAITENKDPAEIYNLLPQEVQKVLHSLPRQDVEAYLVLLHCPEVETKKGKMWLDKFFTYINLLKVAQGKAIKEIL